MSEQAYRDQERLALLVRAGEIFHQSLDVTETLNNVARLAAESFAEICLFDLIDERSERLFVTASAHRDPRKAEMLAGVSEILYVEEFGVHPVVQVTRTGVPFFLPSIDEEALLAHAASRQHENYMRRFEYRSKIVVPVVAQTHIFGALTFVRTARSPEFDARDLSFATEIGRRAGLAVANAKQYHREQHVAESLQRAFLPRRFPSPPGIELSAHYRPGSTDAAIGGDWYDAFANEEGELVLTIGDITGKGVEAARLMVLLRQAVRIAALQSSDPEEIAHICNRVLMAEFGDRLASAFIGLLDPRTLCFRYVSAGHAPPYVRHPDGTLHRLADPSPPLGAFRDVRFTVCEEQFEPGMLLLLYTDGAIEFARDVIGGERDLEALLRSEAIVHASNPAAFIERIVERSDVRDDIAILAASFGRDEARWQFDADDPRSSYAMRDAYFSMLRRFCRVTDEDLATCGLIFSELIGNAVRHAPGPLSVSLEQSNGDLTLHFIDSGPGFDFKAALPEDIWAESGRGLFLISSLARNVRVERVPGRGSHITVTLPLDGSVAHAA